MSTIVYDAANKTKRQVIHKPANWLDREGVKEYITLRATANQLRYEDMMKKIIFDGSETWYFHYDICIGYAFVIHPSFASYLTEQFKRIQSGDLTLAHEITQKHEAITMELHEKLMTHTNLVKEKKHIIECFQATLTDFQKAIEGAGPRLSNYQIALDAAKANVQKYEKQT